MSASSGDERAPVLVTNGWLRTAYSVVESLGRRGVPVHVVDSSSLAMCRLSRWVRGFHLVPNFYKHPQAYAIAIADVAKRIGADVLIPVHEDVLTLAKYRHLLPRQLRLALTDEKNIELCLDKWETIQWCQRIGVPVPASFVPESITELEQRAADLQYPTVIKTRVGNSAKGVAVVHSPRELVDRYKDIVKRAEIPSNHLPLVQEYLGNESFGVCMIYEHGQLKSSFCERYLRCKAMNTFGTSTYRESIYNSEYIENCRRVGDSLGWHGVIMFDLLVDPKTLVAKIIEVNPRFWGALHLAVVAGVDFPYMLYELARDGTISNPPQSYRLNVPCRWIMGDLIGIVSAAVMKGEVAQRRLRHIFDVLKTPLNSPTDDLRLTDPCPFLLEVADYARRYLTSGSVNPIVKGMVR